MKLTTKLWIGVAGLALISPIGLILPEKFKAGPAWGEWGADEVKNFVGYAPMGLKKLTSLWHSIMPNYGFKGWEGKGLAHGGIAYVAAAFIGIVLCAGIAYLIGKVLIKKRSS
jgi:hypothetical protein